jgi:hypothetical protein
MKRQARDRKQLERQTSASYHSDSEDDDDDDQDQDRDGRRKGTAAGSSVHSKIISSSLSGNNIVPRTYLIDITCNRDMSVAAVQADLQTCISKLSELEAQLKDNDASAKTDQSKDTEDSLDSFMNQVQSSISKENLVKLKSNINELIHIKLKLNELLVQREKKVLVSKFYASEGNVEVFKQEQKQKAMNVEPVLKSPMASAHTSVPNTSNAHTEQSSQTSASASATHDVDVAVSSKSTTTAVQSSDKHSSYKNLTNNNTNKPSSNIVKPQNNSNQNDHITTASNDNNSMSSILKRLQEKQAKEKFLPSAHGASASKSQVHPFQSTSNSDMQTASPLGSVSSSLSGVLSSSASSVSISTAMSNNEKTNNEKSNNEKQFKTRSDFHLTLLSHSTTGLIKRKHLSDSNDHDSNLTLSSEAQYNGEKRQRGNNDHNMNYDAYVSGDQDDYTHFAIPKNQKGDGKTHLNSKFGY